MSVGEMSVGKWRSSAFLKLGRSIESGISSWNIDQSWRRSIKWIWKDRVDFVFTHLGTLLIKYYWPITFCADWFVKTIIALTLTHWFITKCWFGTALPDLAKFWTFLAIFWRQLNAIRKIFIVVNGQLLNK